MSKKPVNKILSKWSIDDKPVQIEKWDGTAVKNSLDDMMKKILSEKYNMDECFHIVDGRLIICGLACLISAFALIYDYIRPFPLSKPILIICSISYFILMGLFTLYIKYIEKDIIYVGLKKDASGFDKPKKWTLRTNLKRFDDKFDVVVEMHDPNTNNSNESRLSKSVASWINEDGVIIPELVEKDIAYLYETIAIQKKSN